MGFGDAFSLSNVIAEGIAVGSDIGEVSPYSYSVPTSVMRLFLMSCLWFACWRAYFDQWGCYLTKMVVDSEIDCLISSLGDTGIEIRHKCLE